MVVAVVTGPSLQEQRHADIGEFVPDRWKTTSGLPRRPSGQPACTNARPATLPVRRFSRGSRVLFSLHQEAVSAAGRDERLSSWSIQSSGCVVGGYHALTVKQMPWLPWRPWGNDTCRMRIEAWNSVCAQRRFGAPLQGGHSCDVSGPSPLAGTFRSSSSTTTETRLKECPR